MKIGNEAPSRLLPYNVKELDMGMFGVPQLKLLSKAVSVDSVNYMIEALGAVLNIDANTLTDGDFNYLFAIQRILGYEDHPLLHRWTCQTGRVFMEQGGLKREFTFNQMREMVEQFNNAPESEQHLFQNPKDLQVVPHSCNHGNEIPVTMDDVQIIQVPEIVDLDSRLEWPRVNTLAESRVLKRDPEKANLVDAARWVIGDTMNEKFERLEEGGIALFKAACHADAEYAHGYKRVVTKHCTRCEYEHDSIVHVDAAMFFSV